MLITSVLYTVQNLQLEPLQVESPLTLIFKKVFKVLREWFFFFNICMSYPSTLRMLELSVERAMNLLYSQEIFKLNY